MAPYSRAPGQYRKIAEKGVSGGRKGARKLGAEFCRVDEGRGDEGADTEKDYHQNGVENLFP